MSISIKIADQDTYDYYNDKELVIEHENITVEIGIAADEIKYIYTVDNSRHDEFLYDPEYFNVADIAELVLVDRTGMSLRNITAATSQKQLKRKMLMLIQEMLLDEVDEELNGE